MEKDTEVVVQRNGISLLTILFIIFLILKLTGTVSWSWWIITLPLWIGPALLVGILGVALGICILVGMICLIGYLIIMTYDKIRK